MASKISIGKHISAREVRPKIPQVTKIWEILDSTNTRLGLVKWYAPWRKYCFHPLDGVLFDHSCLTDIAKFMKDNHETRNEEKPAEDAGTV